ncbi:hypothetical protein PENTCL1PPCAC_23885 [Pristionchus entomophagus]|uniref:Lipase n=1 Tax=Pristionchus entomophagus TaxID=358040 RepID=A0AAV5U499_9BILA|nr:hypothetical protein PENTCL1PPCAC_23885 [Pristionchus entomophagus]
MRGLIFLIALEGLLQPSRAEAEDPEAYMDAIDMIRRWGYPAELYDVVTKDGYILDMYRIPHGRFAEANSSCNRPAILMVHGMGVTSTEYFMNPPESSPAFILADQGFDIFLLNLRGTTYGKRHMTLTPDFGSKFWQYTVDEQANYDCTAAIDKVLEVTGQKSTYWIGNSLGTILGFMTLADNPEYNSKIKSLHQVGPVGTVHTVKGLTRFGLFWYRTLKPIVDWYRKTLGSHEILPQWPWLYRPLGQLCKGGLPFLGPEICYDLFFFLMGPPAKTFNMSRAATYLSHFPCGSSSWNFLHLAQLVTRGKVEHMDHNPEENMRRYGQVTPPPYNYSNIDVPIYLYWGRNDWDTNGPDIEHYILPNIRKDLGGLEVPGYNHIDFAIATDCAEKVWNPMAEIMRNENNRMCER